MARGGGKSNGFVVEVEVLSVSVAVAAAVGVAAAEAGDVGVREPWGEGDVMVASCCSCGSCGS